MFSLNTISWVESYPCTNLQKIKLRLLFDDTYFPLKAFWDLFLIIFLLFYWCSYDWGALEGRGPHYSLLVLSVAHTAGRYEFNFHKIRKIESSLFMMVSSLSYLKKKHCNNPSSIKLRQYIIFWPMGSNNIIHWESSR